MAKKYAIVNQPACSNVFEVDGDKLVRRLQHGRGRCYDAGMVLIRQGHAVDTYSLNETGDAAQMFDKWQKIYGIGELL